MSRLDELISQYCPNGVEYKTIEELCEVQNGYTPSKKVSEYWDNGDFPWFRMEDIRANGKELSDSIQHVNLAGVKGKGFPAYSIIFATTATIGEHALITVPFICNQQLTHIHIRENIKSILDIRFLFYYSDIIDELCKKNTKGGSTLPAVSLDKFKQFLVPVPPLEVQREIVHILDNFTELTAELTTELTAELTARKKQYEYYRDNILTFDTTIKHVRLGDICSVITKGTTPKSYTKTGVSFVKTEAFDGAKIIPNKLSYVDEETHTTFLKRSMLEENDILITIAGATIGKCAIVPKEILPANTNQALAIIRLAKGNSPKYVMYLLQSDLMKRYMQKNIKGSAQPNLNLKQLNDFIIPLPPLNVQERLVRVLDNFEAICTDLNIGLPAEIEARQKQYEYYRDLLLTFAAEGATILTDRQTGNN